PNGNRFARVYRTSSFEVSAQTRTQRISPRHRTNFGSSPDSTGGSKAGWQICSDRSGDQRSVLSVAELSDLRQQCSDFSRTREVLKNAGVDDTVVILVSGHGAYDLSQEATYYYGTYNVDVKNLPATAVSFDEIESLLRDIVPRRKLLLLDTCESGEMDDSTRA